MSWPTVSLSSATFIDRTTVAPGAMVGGYIGLEHILSTGEIQIDHAISTDDLSSSKFIFSPRHVLFGKLRPYLRKVARPNFDGVCSTDILPILPKPNLDRDYLYHYLRSPEVIDLATARSSGANLPRISPSLLAEFPIQLPPLEEQKRIAAILDKADAIRRKREQAIKLADEFLRSLFLDMFGDPIRNPKGWPIRRTGELLKLPPQIGTIRPASEDGVHRVVRVGEIGMRSIRLDRTARVKVSPPELERYLLAEGDLLLARAIGSEDHLGKASVFNACGEQVLFDSHVMRLRFDQSLVRPTFFREWLATIGGRTSFMRHAGRTAVQFNINGEQIRRVEIALPPLTLQVEFEKILKKGLAIVEKPLHDEQLFASLSQRAFRGEL